MAANQQLQQMVADFVSLAEHLDVAKQDAAVSVAATQLKIFYLFIIIHNFTCFESQKK